MEKKESRFIVTDLSTEYEINTFFRLENNEIIEELRKRFTRSEEKITKKEVFLMLRELRNRW